jgi:putative ABC transport system ATP-binding protein
MIRAEHVWKVYRGHDGGEVLAVDDVSLTIPPGRFAALTGPSGSGKTTLLSLLGALSRPSGGSIELDGRELSTCSDVELARTRRKIGFVFQNFSLVPRLAVWENVTYPLIPRGVRTPDRHECAREVLQRLGLANKMNSRPDQLSGGEQQRVAVARALASEPKILLADEPTSNLDRRAADELAESFRQIHASGVTLVLSTHRPELLEMASIVFEMNEGRLTCHRDAGGQEQRESRSFSG